MSNKSRLNKYLPIFILLATVNVTFAQQPYLNERYNTDVYEIAWNALKTDSGYLVVGMNASTLNTFWNIELLFLDSGGNTASIKTYGKNLTRYFAGGPGSFIKTFGGGFAMAGSIEDTTGYDLMLFRFDNNGDTLWTRQYGDTLWQAANQCKQTPDNGFIIVGRTGTTDPDGDFWLIKTDSLGNVEWDTTYGGQYYEYGVSVDVCSDGGYILAGPTDSYGINSGPFSNNRPNIYIVKVDSMGVQQWDTVLGNEYRDVVWNVLTLSDGGYLVAGSLTDYEVIDFPYGQPYLIKLDSVGNTVWEKTYGPVRFQTTLRMARELADGSIIACGHTTDSVGFHGMGLVLKVASNGDSLWYKTHEILPGDNSENFLYDIRPTSDNGFIAAGWLAPDSPDTGGQDMWVIKLDSMGCAVENCFVGIEERQEPGIKMQVFPNPFNHMATVKISNSPAPGSSSINIYDLTGRKIKTYPVPQHQNTLTLKAEEIGTGMFFIQLASENDLVSTQKIIICE